MFHNQVFMLFLLLYMLLLFLYVPKTFVIFFHFLSGVFRDEILPHLHIGEKAMLIHSGTPLIPFVSPVAKNHPQCSPFLCQERKGPPYDISPIRSPTTFGNISVCLNKCDFRHGRTVEFEDADGTDGLPFVPVDDHIGFLVHVLRLSVFLLVFLRSHPLKES